MPEIARRPLRLLVVEDSENDTFFLVHELRRAGFAVTHQRVDTPAAMRAALEQGTWDAITSDHIMPAFSAPAALALAKELRPEIPFIIVSGEIDINLAVSLMKAGAMDYIQKRELPLLAPALQRGLEEVELRRQRQQAEEQRRISEEKFYKAFHNCPDSIHLTRLSDGVYLEVNAGFERLFGYRAEKVIGKSTIEMNVWNDLADRDRLAAKLLKDGKFDNEEIFVRNWEGVLVPLLASARLITVNGEICVLSFNRDIREQRLAEEEIRRQNRELQIASQLLRQHADELEARVAERTSQLTAINQELEAFTFTVAHDLRAPLRAITAYSQILLEDHRNLFDGDSRICLDNIVQASLRMHQLIDDLLRFSRLNRVPMNVVPLDLSAMAQRVAEDLQRHEPQRRAIWIIAENLWAAGDANLLYTVLENLLGNAWKFTAHQPQAQIEFGQQESTDGPVYFVRDNGAGFNPQYADRLFEVFQRLHSEAEFPGIGIGLASVKRIIQRHAGRVWAEGQVNQGSTFFFTLER